MSRQEDYRKTRRYIGFALWLSVVSLIGLAIVKANHWPNYTAFIIVGVLSAAGLWWYDSRRR